MPAGLFVLTCSFWLSMRIEGLQRIKWILPLLMILPFNRYLPEGVALVAALLNVVATGAYFFLMARFMLQDVRERE